jgi:transposase, IS30 family
MNGTGLLNQRSMQYFRGGTFHFQMQQMLNPDCFQEDGMTRSFTQLSLDERRVLAQLLQTKARLAYIADVLGRSRSTIHREIKRNWWHDTEVPQADGYWHVTAQSLSENRRRSYRKLCRYPALRHAVIDRLQAGWSPEQIAGRIKIAPERQHRICHETIYQYVYSQDGQSQELARLLPERRRKRKPRHARRGRGLVFPDTMAIRNRPEIINDRGQFGHWEGDLMIFRREHGLANIATLVERKSRYTVLFRNNDRQSKPIMNRLINELSPLPHTARQSITFDRGFEFVSWRQLETGMGTKAWFCDPRAPWQKGSVENMNKRVRRYLPRDTDLLSLPPRTMMSICERLNGTPRKCLGYKTPTEVFRHQLIEITQSTD